MNTFARITTAGAALLMPMSVAALTLDAQESIAGFGATITLSEPANGTLIAYPPYGSAIEKEITSDTVRLNGSETEIAGFYDIEVVDQEGNLTAETSISIGPESLDPVESTLQSIDTALSPNGFDAVTVQVIARDRYGNVLSGRPVELISSREADRITALQSETDDTGTQEFTVTTQLPGMISLRAIDLLSGKVLGSELHLDATSGGIGGYGAPTLYGPASGIQNAEFRMQNSNPRSIPNPTPNPNPNALLGLLLQQALLGQVNGFDVVSSFQIEAPLEMQVNQDATIRIRALDSNGRRVEDFVGTVLLASTDPTALLPLNGEVQFTPQNLGEKTLTLGLRFRTPGQHILHVEDSADPSISAQITINVMGDEEPFDPTILITSHDDDSLISKRAFTLEGIGPPFVNLFVSGGVQDILTETNEDGEFSVGINLNPAETEFTLRVRDESGRFDSGSLHLSFDDTAPEVESLSFDPNDPQEGEDVTLTVEASGFPNTISVDLNGETLTLEEDLTSSGTYTVTFPAPPVGSYQPIVVAEDRAGNEREVRGNLVIEKGTLPQVTNVTSEAEGDAITLSWSPITSEEIDAYRIYVGDSPTNFLYTLETERATTSATVAGLDAGQEYFFAVTALQEDRESLEKSTVISDQILAMGLEVTPQNDALFIEWMHDDSIGVSSFILEYGSEPGNFTEQRIISGDQRAYTLRDLIGGIPYYFTLTPVSIEGEVLSLLTSEGDGVPTESAVFAPATPEPIPTSVVGKNPPVPQTDPLPPLAGPLHSGAPRIPYTPSSGAPIALWVFGAAGSYMLWKMRGKKKVHHTGGSMIDIRASN